MLYLKLMKNLALMAPLRLADARGSYHLSYL